MKPPKPSSESGFSLVEVALALGVVSFCLVALMGMITVGLNSSGNATAETGAASLLTAVAADLRDTPLATTAVPVPSSPFFQIPVPTPAPSPVPSPAPVPVPKIFYVDSGGGFASTLAALPAARFQVTVTTLASPPSTTPTYSTTEQVVIAWPAQASAAKAAGSVEGIVELNRN
jgi:Tfp pilus assembly protein PilV